MLQQELRPLVKVPQHNIALLFCNYLKSVEVQAQVQNEDAGFIIYCQRDKHEFAQQEFEQFIADPYQAKYQQAAWQSSDVTDVNSNSPTLLSSFKTQFFAHAGIVTSLVFALCWLVFLASNFGWGNTIFQYLQFYPQPSFDTLLQAPHRLIGPAFFTFHGYILFLIPCGGGN